MGTSLIRPQSPALYTLGQKKRRLEEEDFSMNHLFPKGVLTREIQGHGKWKRKYIPSPFISLLNSWYAVHYARQGNVFRRYLTVGTDGWLSESEECEVTWLSCTPFLSTHLCVWEAVQIKWWGSVRPKKRTSEWEGTSNLPFKIPRFGKPLSENEGGHGRLLCVAFASADVPSSKTYRCQSQKQDRSHLILPCLCLRWNIISSGVQGL